MTLPEHTAVIEELDRLFSEWEILNGQRARLKEFILKALAQAEQRGREEAVKHIETAEVYKLPSQGELWRIDPAEFKKVLDQARNPHQ